MWSPTGQQVMIPTPRQPEQRYGIGAVNYHTGETVVLFERRKRRREIAKLLEALVAKHPTGTIYVVWDNADTHQDDEVEAVVRRGRSAGPAVPADLQPLAQPHRDALAPLPTRGDPLRAVREHQGPRHRRHRLLRPLQPGARPHAVRHRRQSRDRCVNVLRPRTLARVGPSWSCSGISVWRGSSRSS